jgi:hypothetical protein
VGRQAAGHQLRVDAAEIVAMARGRRRKEVTRRLDRAEHHTNLDALLRLTEPVGGDRRFVEDPPLQTTSTTSTCGG